MQTSATGTGPATRPGPTATTRPATGEGAETRVAAELDGPPGAGGPLVAGLGLPGRVPAGAVAVAPVRGRPEPRGR